MAVLGGVSVYSLPELTVFIDWAVLMALSEIINPFDLGREICVLLSDTVIKGADIVQPVRQQDL